MNLMNKSVLHIKYGKGIIVSQEPEKVIVQFDVSIGNKTFPYPEGFLHLKLDDEVLSERVENALIQRKTEEDNKREVQLRTWRIQDKIKRVKGTKYLHKNNISIKCNYCNGGSNQENWGYKGICSDTIIKHNILEKKHTWCCSEDSLCLKYLNGEISRKELDLNGQDGLVCYESKMLIDWKAYAGIVQTGVRKGQPMAFRDLSSNMLAVLTTRLPGMEEHDRIIFAVFLVMSRCEGDEEIEGYIEAYPDYRIELSLEEARQVKFWNYYYNENKPEVIRMGSGLHRYLTDDQAVQILMNIYEVKSSLMEKEHVKQFIDHFCEVKDVDVSKVSESQGGLTRVK